MTELITAISLGGHTYTGRPVRIGLEIYKSTLRSIVTSPIDKFVLASTDVCQPQKPVESGPLTALNIVIRPRLSSNLSGVVPWKMLKWMAVVLGSLAWWHYILQPALNDEEILDV